jgi:UDP-N-acetylglucosamine--N-acetylmuramyl-(pentapeptide) pyrophosphoryl-undecaprenol N-acetylglucosamine transferase
MTSKSNIFLATGGTGGHIFPALALAEELRIKGYQPIIVTDTKYKKYIQGLDSEIVYFVPSASPNKTMAIKILAYIKIIQGIFKALWLISKHKPVIVVGFGGYPSFPTLMAAKIYRIPIIIHEQNSIFGKVNKYFASSAIKIASTFAEMTGVSAQNAEKVVYTGIPVRKSIKKIGLLDYPIFSESTDLNLLVIGGSQGAAIFSHVVPRAIEKLPTELKQRIVITQQCRKEDLDSTKKFYEEIGIKANLAVFFNDIDEKLAQAQLVISRAGASTIAELTVAGKPAIYVPYPYSTANHQFYNCSQVTKNNSGWIILEDNFTPSNVADTIQKIFNTPSLLNEAAAKTKQPYPNATLKLVEVIEDVKMKVKN